MIKLLSLPESVARAHSNDFYQSPLSLKMSTENIPKSFFQAGRALKKFTVSLTS